MAANTTVDGQIFTFFAKNQCVNANNVESIEIGMCRCTAGPTRVTITLRDGKFNVYCQHNATKVLRWDLKKTIELHSTLSNYTLKGELRAALRSYRDYVDFFKDPQALAVGVVKLDELEADDDEEEEQEGAKASQAGAKHKSRHASIVLSPGNSDFEADHPVNVQSKAHGFAHAALEKLTSLGPAIATSTAGMALFTAAYFANAPHLQEMVCVYGEDAVRHFIGPANPTATWVLTTALKTAAWHARMEMIRQQYRLADPLVPSPMNTHMQIGPAVNSFSQHLENSQIAPSTNAALQYIENSQIAPSTNAPLQNLQNPQNAPPTNATSQCIENMQIPPPTNVTLQYIENDRQMELYRRAQADAEKRSKWSG